MPTQRQKSTNRRLSKTLRPHSSTDPTEPTRSRIEPTTAEEISRYATRFAGTRFDLDRDLEAAALEALLDANS